jgi:phenol hydroxylase P4 protein
MKTLGPYVFEARDRQEVFLPDQLVYVHVEGAYEFCAPACFRAPRDMSLADFLEQMVRPWLASWPTWADVDIRKAGFLRNGEAIEPQWETSLAAQGIGHKDFLTMQVER